ncbi:hypothetical protein HK102_000088 [Quaeritorhiza haematococci]|nr:hypothetical protein HK102_000088 [Quaeritorhiza haematococci]
MAAALTPPDELKFISPYLQRAQELHAREPIVAYYCNYYAAKLAIDKGLKAKDSQEFLLKLMDALEKDKQNLVGNEAITNDVVGYAHIENFALKIFVGADNEDRSGKATKLTAKKFLAASIFLELLRVFGDTDTEIEEKIKYAKFKAVDIIKAFKEGRTPTPGPPSKVDETAAETPDTTTSGQADVPPPLPPTPASTNSPYINADLPNTLPPQSGTVAPPFAPSTNVDPTMAYSSSGTFAPQPSFDANAYSINSQDPNLHVPSPPQPTHPGYTFPDATSHTTSTVPPLNPTFIPPSDGAASVSLVPPSAPHIQPFSQHSVPTSNRHSIAGPYPPVGSSQSTGYSYPSVPGSRQSYQGPPSQGPTIMDAYKRMSFTPSHSSFGLGGTDGGGSSGPGDVHDAFSIDHTALTSAQKHSKFAISALQYDDIPTAIENLEKALALLQPFRNWKPTR